MEPSIARERAGIRRVAMIGAALLAAAGLALVPQPGPAAGAEDVVSVPDGCYGVASGASGFYRSISGSPSAFDLDVEGPVVTAVVEWAGVWMPDPAATTLGVGVAGPGGTLSDPAVPGTLVERDPTGLPGMPSFAHGYLADVTELFGDGDPGAYRVTLTPPDVGLPGENVWWGATVTVLYDTSPCATPSRVLWKSGADYFFGGAGAPNPTTSTIVYDWGYPLAEDATVTLQLAHGGAQHDTTACRVSSIWTATGSGTAPQAADALVSADGVPNPVWGAVESVVRPFTPPMQSCDPPQVTFPVVGYSGGHVGPQWALVQLGIVVPAGSTWTAIQLESPRDGGGGAAIPESGAWAGAGVLLVPVPAQPAEPGILLEKTVLAGDDPSACPGVEGTDELVVVEAGEPVTYCFRIVDAGDTHLFPVGLDDVDLGIDQDDAVLVAGDDTVPLPPGGELVFGYVATPDADLVNTATATGVPSDANGDPLPDLDPVGDENDAEVRLAPPSPTPAVSLAVSVVAGDDPAACAAGPGEDELVVASGAPAVFCYHVGNPGETMLSPVELVDDGLGVTDAELTVVSGSTAALAPGEQLVLAYPVAVTVPLESRAVATGTPGGGLDPVSAEDGASVRPEDTPTPTPTPVPPTPVPTPTPAPGDDTLASAGFELAGPGAAALLAVIAGAALAALRRRRPKAG
ncbi:hypothetical protein [Agromyces archimandritae]|uniref:Uncharacterized protein n=1 Tax=Agromyces archimandritae TaxID=2781962 RepID=A0A975FNG7_9MICO|nr:hypothetical protein [Agromyces archimandritae]QTX05364.1 hypothetical protein G127AT_03815 [Agromyces archimandritae]